jgi:hypothetical protein
MSGRGLLAREQDRAEQVPCAVWRRLVAQPRHDRGTQVADQFFALVRA